LELLEQNHKNHLLPIISVEDEENSERTIQILSADITETLQKVKAKCTRLNKQEVSPQEEMIKKNLISNVATQLQDLSGKFRNAQKDYLQRLQARQKRGKGGFVITEDENDDHFQVNFTNEQMVKVSERDTTIAQRAEEIRQIAKSINELASIFQDLSTLVIEQGTILDRIDYNIELVDHNVVKGVGELVKANESQKGTRNKLCMLLLCIGIAVLVFVVILKKLIF